MAASKFGQETSLDFTTISQCPRTNSDERSNIGMSGLRCSLSGLHSPSLI